MPEDWLNKTLRPWYLYCGAPLQYQIITSDDINVPSTNTTAVKANPTRIGALPVSVLSTGSGTRSSWPTQALPFWYFLYRPNIPSPIHEYLWAPVLWVYMFSGQYICIPSISDGILTPGEVTLHTDGVFECPICEHIIVSHQPWAKKGQVWKCVDREPIS